MDFIIQSPYRCICFAFLSKAGQGAVRFYSKWGRVFCCVCGCTCRMACRRRGAMCLLNPPPQWGSKEQ